MRPLTAEDPDTRSPDKSCPLAQLFNTVGTELRLTPLYFPAALGIAIPSRCRNAVSTRSRSSNSKIRQPLCVQGVRYGKNSPSNSRLARHR
jgi:hypothetical protein